MDIVSDVAEADGLAQRTDGIWCRRHEFLRQIPIETGVADRATDGGILEFLRHRTPLAAEALTSPGATLNALVSSPEAQSLGHALQEQMQGIATDSSSLDYLLAAVILQLDPESITAPQRNNVAGFDLADDSLRGKSAAQIVDALRQHLVAQGKTSPELAGAAAHLLLAGRAPVFLVKDIPDSVTFGSPAWVNLAIAATMVDAHIPGRVANMSFAAVMLEAEHASGADVNMTNTAQRNALIDWGTANGLLEKKAEHLYASDELNNLVTRFSERQSLMLAASEAFDKDIPSRKAMALAELKQRFPDWRKPILKPHFSAGSTSCWTCVPPPIGTEICLRPRQQIFPRSMGRSVPAGRWPSVTPTFRGKRRRARSCP